MSVLMPSCQSLSRIRGILSSISLVRQQNVKLLLAPCVARPPKVSVAIVRLFDQQIKVLNLLRVFKKKKNDDEKYE